MMSFKDYLVEGNELQQKVNKHISKGVGIGTISPEGKHTDNKEKKAAAHSDIRADLEAARQAGHIGGWSGPHKGQYRYGGESDVSHEGSYIAHAKSDSDDHHDQMMNKLKEIGNKHKQEAVMSVNAKTKEGHWHYLKNSSQEGKKESQGKLTYNRPLKKDTGRTQLKKSPHSFTTVV